MFIHKEHISWNQQESQEILKGPNLKPYYFALNIPSALPLKSLLKTQKPSQLKTPNRKSFLVLRTHPITTGNTFESFLADIEQAFFCTNKFIRTSRLKMIENWRTNQVSQPQNSWQNFQNTELHRIFLKEQCKKKIKNMEAQMGKILRTPSFERFL